MPDIEPPLLQDGDLPMNIEVASKQNSKVAADLSNSEKLPELSNKMTPAYNKTRVAEDAVTQN